MAAIVNNDKIEVRIFCWHAIRQQLAVNVRHYLADTVVGLPTTLQAAADIDTVMGAWYPPCMAIGAQYYGVGVKNLGAPSTAPDFNGTNRANGTVAGDALPLQTSGVITLRTGFTGRNNRGRVYVPFPAEAHNTVSGAPDLAYLGVLASLATALISNINVDDLAGNSCVLKPVILQGTGGTVFVTSNVPRDKWGTQRRRGMMGRQNTVPF